MRKLLVGLALLGALLGSSLGVAGPPSGDPSGGNGQNGNAGCRGIERAEQETPGPSDPAMDLVNRILGCNS